VSLMVLWCQYCHTGEVKLPITLTNTRGKIQIKTTWRNVHITIVAVESNKYWIL